MKICINENITVFTLVSQIQQLKNQEALVIPTCQGTTNDHYDDCGRDFDEMLHCYRAELSLVCCFNELHEALMCFIVIWLLPGSVAVPAYFIQLL